MALTQSICGSSCSDFWAVRTNSARSPWLLRGSRSTTKPKIGNPSITCIYIYTCLYYIYLYGCVCRYLFTCTHHFENATCSHFRTVQGPHENLLAALLLYSVVPLCGVLNPAWDNVLLLSVTIWRFFPISQTRLKRPD